MKCKTAPGSDNIDIDTLKDGGEPIACILAKIYTYCIKQRAKGMENIRNYVFSQKLRS